MVLIHNLSSSTVHSKEDQHNKEEHSLDPENWDQFRQLSHKMLDDMIDLLQHIREYDIWKPIDQKSKDFLNGSLPNNPQSQESIYDEFKTHILPYRMGNIHPRFWGWVIGTGTPFGMVAELLAAALNPNQGGGNQSAGHVENQVIEWFKEVFNFPSEASGIVVSGGSMANFVGLAVARNTKIENIRNQGFYETGKQFVLYGSTEMHNSVDKAVDLLGFGNVGLRKISVDVDYKIKLEELEKQIQQDKYDGMIPICIIGNAGTVNTAATDDLNSLADVCRKEKLWFHVDGAFGSLVKITKNYTDIVNGMDRADSLAFDLHKWMYVQYEAGMVLIRKRLNHYETFSHSAEYLEHGSRGVHGGKFWYNDYGIQLSRGFKSLKIWMSLKEHGFTKYGVLIEQNIEQAQYLKKLVDDVPELELTAPVPLNIVCFRYKGEITSNELLNHLNKLLLIQIHENAIAVPTYTTLNNIYTIRVAITNHRSTRADFDLLIESMVFLGKKLEIQLKS